MLSVDILPIVQLRQRETQAFERKQQIKVSRSAQIQPRLKIDTSCRWANPSTQRPQLGKQPPCRARSQVPVTRQGQKSSSPGRRTLLRAGHTPPGSAPRLLDRRVRSPPRQLARPTRTCHAPCLSLKPTSRRCPRIRVLKTTRSLLKLPHRLRRQQPHA